MICLGRSAATQEAIAVNFDAKIASVQPLAEGKLPPENDGLIAPGFIDLQVNGFGGVDFNAPGTTVDDIGRALRAMFETGVTRCLPTIITGPQDSMLACLETLLRAQTELPYGHAIAGFHIEGPHIGPEDGPRGAHPAIWVRPPDLDEFKRWQDATEGQIRIVTLSPHWPNAADYIRSLTGAGVVVSIGHTSADAKQIAEAVQAGATLSTHLGNAATRLMPKFPNCLWDQLADDRLSASFIVDGWHLDEAYLKVALRAKTIERTILVTDAAAPAGAEPGKYRLGELEVELTEDERVVLQGSSKLAGSALRMDRALENLIRIGGVSLADALQTATTNPARLIGLEGHMQGIEPGERGDIVVFRDKSSLRPEAVYLEGVRVA